MLGRPFDAMVDAWKVKAPFTITYQLDISVPARRRW